MTCVLKYRDENLMRGACMLSSQNYDRSQRHSNQRDRDIQGVILAVFS